MGVILTTYYPGWSSKCVSFFCRVENVLKFQPLTKGNCLEKQGQPSPDEKSRKGRSLLQSRAISFAESTLPETNIAPENG